MLLALATVGLEQELRTINPPGGGTIVCGQVAGQTTEAGAMGTVLRSVHQNVGEKPHVGKLFGSAPYTIGRHVLQRNAPQR